MKRVVCFALALSAIVAINSCAPKKTIVQPVVKVYQLTDSTPAPDGSIIYALPMTVFGVTVEFIHTIETPGPYAKYAQDLLGIKDAIMKERETWEISGIYLKSSYEPDPSEFYIIESSSLLKTNALALRRSGLIMDINPELFEDQGSLSEQKRYTESALRFEDLGADEYYVAQNDTAYRVVKLDTTFVRIPYLVERKKLLSVDQLADKAARAILELRDGKQFILTGEANVFPQSTAGIDEINRLEKEYMALFTGKTVTETRRINLTIIPEKDKAGKPLPLFRLSPESGPKTGSAGTGDLVSLVLEPAGKTKDITIVTRPVSTEKGIIAEVHDKLYYRVPDVVNVKISKGSEVLYETRKLVYQFGQIVQLPSNYLLLK